MPKLNWDANDFQDSQDSSGTTSDLVSHNGNLQQGYKHGSLTEGLVAYYPMEKGEGEILHDGAFDNLGQIKPGSSGSNTSASDMWTNGKIGNNALNFDGTDDKVSTTNEINPENHITISAWFKTNDNTVRQIVIGKDNGSDRDYVLQHSGQTERTLFHLQDNSGSVHIVTANNVISDNTWHNVIGTYDGSKMEIYVDGVKQSSNSSSFALNDGDSNLIIGSRENNGNEDYHDGPIDDVRIYDRALSEPEIKALFNEGNGIQSGVLKQEKDVLGQNESGISRYKLDGNTDDSWGSNDGTNKGADLTATGVYGKAAKFNGSTEYVNIGSLDIQKSKPFTLSAWINTDTTGEYNTILGQLDGDGNYLEFRMNRDGGYDARVGVSGGNYVSANGFEHKKTWLHYLATYDPSGPTIKLYMNGSLVASDTGSVDEFSNSNDVWLGERTDNPSNHFDGKIDDVRIYDKALTPVQVEKLYHKGAYRISRESTLQ